jgi:hypothetical protein
MRKRSSQCPIRAERLSRCDTPDLNIKLLSKLKLADYTLIVDDTQRSGANTGGIYYRDRYTFFPLRADELCFFSEGDEDGERNNLAFIHKTLLVMNTTTPPRWTDTLARLRI